MDGSYDGGHSFGVCNLVGGCMGVEVIAGQGGGSCLVLTAAAVATCVAAGIC